MDESVDLVCPWVTYDTALARELERYKKIAGPNAAVPSPARYRDFGELRYSIEAACQFMPWLNRIYIVTNGQIPPSSVLSMPKVQHCTHWDFFRNPGHLPTFSASAIGINTAFIQGLSERYLLTNDDVFVGRPLDKASILGRGNGIHLFANENLNRYADCSNIWRSRVYATESILQRQFGKLRRKLFSHTPQLFSRTGMKRVWEEYPAYMETVSSGRVPAPGHILSRLLFLYGQLYRKYGRLDFEEIATQSGGEVRLVRPSDFCHLSLTTPGGQWVQRMEQVIAERPAFFCLNDDIPDAHYESVSSAAVGFLQRYYDY